MKKLGIVNTQRYAVFFKVRNRLCTDYLVEKTLFIYNHPYFEGRTVIIIIVVIIIIIITITKLSNLSGYQLP